MTSYVEYYNPNKTLKQNGQWDDGWLAALSDVIASTAAEIDGVNAQTKVIQFVVGTAMSVGNSYTTTDVYLELGFVDAEHVRVGQETYLREDVQLVNNLINASVTTSASILITAGLGISSISLIGIVVAGAVGYGYSKLINPSISEALDYFSGTVDIDLHLKDASGDFVYGALYKDGYYPSDNDFDQSLNLLNEAIDAGVIAQAEAGMKIEVFTGTSQTPAVYTLYDDNILLAISNATNTTDYNVMRDMAEGVEHLNMAVKDVLISSENGGFNVEERFFKTSDILIKSEDVLVIGDGDHNLLIDITTGNATSSMLGGGGSDILFGGAGEDNLLGGEGDDVIHGDGGSTMPSESGADHLYGGIGDDFLYGGAGNDYLDGESGDDFLYGEGGEDTFIGGFGWNMYDGGADIDTVTYATSNAALKLSNNPDGSFDVRKYHTQTSPVGEFVPDMLISIENFILGAAQDLIDVISINGLKFDGGGETDTLDYGRSGYGITVTLQDAAMNYLHNNYLNNLEISGFTSNSAWTHLGRNIEIIRGTGHQDTFIIEEMAVGRHLFDGMTLDGALGTDTLDASDQDEALTFDLITGELHLNPTINFSNFEIFKGGSAGDTFKVNDVQKEYKFYGNDNGDIGDVVDYSGVNAFLKVLSIPALGAGNYTVEKYYGQTSATGAYITDYLYSIEDIIGDTSNGISIDGAGGTVVQGQGMVNGTVVSVSYLSGQPNVAVTLLGTTYGENMFGGNGNDRIEGKGGNDFLHGGAGNDTYVYRKGDGTDQFSNTGYAGEIETVELKGISSSEVTFAYHALNSYVTMTIAGGGEIRLAAQYTKPISYIKLSDTILDMETVLVPVYGTNGADGLQGTRDNGNTLREGALINDLIYGYGGNDSIGGGTGVDTIYGGDGNDSTLSGGDGGDYIYGENGNDVISGDAGDDFLYGGANDDHLQGQAGNDTFEGGTGNDLLTDIGSSNDIYIYESGLDSISDSYGADVLRLKGTTTIEDLQFFSQNTVHLKLVINAGVDEILIQHFIGTPGYRIETIQFSDGTYAYFPSYANWARGTSGDDTMTGTSNADTMIGNLGNDTVSGGSGDDALFGGGGNDLLQGGDGLDRLYGADGNDTLYGGASVDTILGQVGDDIIYGDGGNDLLSGGFGYDELFGNVGSDTFRFEADSAYAQSDTLRDFNLTDNDKIDLSDLLSEYDSLTELITDFVQITASGSDSIVSVDADGGANNFVQIATLLGITGLTDEAALVTSGNLLIA